MKKLIIAAVATLFASTALADEQVIKLKQAPGVDAVENNCQACHQENGEGVPNAFPPLAGSDYLGSDKARAIKTVTGGLEQKLVVNGKEFNGVMPAWDLSDEDIESCARVLALKRQAHLIP